MDTVDAEYEEISEPGHSVAVRTGSEVAVTDTMTLDQLVAQVTLIQGAMQKVMKVDEHYGVIPGTQKPTLYKPGAEKLLLLFRLAPEYDVERQEDGNHLTAWVTCRLTHIPTGQFMGSGVGSCSTKESKYATRQAKRVCPVCNVAAIIKGKEQYGGGWLCWKKSTPNAGCGATFKDDDARITGQVEGQIENPDLPDLYNTIIKMGCKRALVAAVLNATAASDIFTQDMEDTVQPAASAGSAGRETSGAAREEAPAAPADNEDARVAGLQAVLDGIEKLKDKPEWSLQSILDASTSSFGRQVNALDDLSLRELRDIYKGMVQYGGLGDDEPKPKPEAKVAE